MSLRKPVVSFRGLFLMLIGLSLHTGLHAQSAEAAYAAQIRGQYAQAIALYDSLLKAGYTSADLHYNLSLAYHAQGDLGRAILHLEKAARLKPYDREIQTNLRLLRNEQQDGILPLPQFFLKNWILSLGARLAVDTWAVLACLFAVLAVLILAAGLRGWALPMRKLWPLGMSILMVLSILCVVVAAYRSKELARTDQGVLLPAELTPRVAPAADAEDQFTVHAGLRVRILDRFEDWTKIQLPDGREGWLPQAAVGQI
ncbi:MAG: hypothetical protein D6772_14470 [Bacteroidetes bacterium]|nr:MAG: hypothetical protein D6772_14470 [Bacteroidota bacterium]